MYSSRPPIDRVAPLESDIELFDEIEAATITSRMSSSFVLSVSHGSETSRRS